MKTPERRQASSGVVGEQLNLIDPPAFCPVFPKPTSMAGRALAMLLQTPAGVTSPDFQAVTRSWRLAAYVFELITEYGWPIDVVEIPFSDDRTRFMARYFMPEWMRQELGANHG